MGRARSIHFNDVIRMAAIAVFVAGIICGVPVAKGQSVFGSVRGVTLDATGSAIPNARVTLMGLDDSSLREATSGDDGLFEFLNLKAGRYRLAGKKEGFADAKLPEFALAARQELRENLTLSVASQAQTVEVSAASEQINTENGTIAGSLANSQITELPLNARAVSTSPLSALSLSGNVQQDSQGNISLGGATSSMVGYSVDGISTANVRQNGALADPYPSSEGIAELRVTAFNNDAEFAQVGDVTFTTKSGTNQFHGSLFEYFQNDALEARILNFSEKAPKDFNTFGGSLGGPVVLPKIYNGQSKTFFFFDYEGNQRQTSTPEQYLVPTQAQRDGNLGGVTIPTGNISATSLALLNNYYPLPNFNQNVANPSFNYETLVPTPASTNGLDFRVDQTLTSKQQIFARVSWKNLSTDVANPLLPNDVDAEHNRSLLVSYNYAISQQWVDEFRFGLTNVVVGVNFPIQGQAALTQLGLLGVDTSAHPDAEAFPTFNFSAATGFTPIGRDRAGVTRSQTTQFADNITHIRGKHTMRFGADVRRLRYHDLMFFEPSDDYGLFTFEGSFTGNSFGDFLEGLPYTSFFAITSPDVTATSTHLGVYGQDTWQVSERLTVNFGLRWELMPPFTEAIGDLGSFDPRNNSVLVPDALANALANNAAYQAVNLQFLQSFNACSLGYTALPCTHVLTASQDHLPQGLRQLYTRDFDPRISAAFRPFRDGKTVVRAGFGIFTVTTLGPMSFNNAGNPLSAVHTYQNYTPGQPAQYQFPQTAPPTQTVQIGGGTLDQGNDPRFRDPQSAQWNLTVERELGGSTALRVTYAGMNSYRLTQTEDLNQIAPSTTPYVPSPYVDPRAAYQNWFTLLSTENSGFSNYQALQVEGNHRLTKGLSFQAFYTFAKNLSDAQGDAPNGFASEVAYGLAVSNRFDMRANRGNVDGTPRHRFQLNGVYQVPFGSGRRWTSGSRFVNGLLGGWDLSTVTLLHTGPWLTPTINPAEDQSNTDIAARGTILRPDCVGNPVPANRTSAEYFNINAFAATPANAGRLGNCGVGILEGPGTIAVAAGIGKVFPIGEHAKLRFESTFTNVLNHTNFASPALDISNAQTFGVLQSAQTAENAGNRTGQLALRLDF
jgi:hypothetical protein